MIQTVYLTGPALKCLDNIGGCRPELDRDGCQQYVRNWEQGVHGGFQH